MTEWKSKNEAPKDGTNILVFDIESNEPNIAYYEDVDEYSSPWWEYFSDVNIKFDFWMPLPSPPEKKHECQDHDWSVIEIDGILNCRQKWLSAEYRPCPFCPLCGGKA